jgi:alcohol dehydrogenase
LMELVAHGRIDLSPLLTHRFMLDDIQDAFDLFSHQRDGVMKVALHPQALPGQLRGTAAGALALAR